MASFTLTNNLKLRLDSNLTANAKYNLQRIDSLAGITSIDQEDDVNIRSVANIQLRPEDASVGGSGVGGQVILGESSQPLELLTIYTTESILGNTFSSNDQATGGTKRLIFQYKSDLNGSTDGGANRTLSFDLDGADRSLIIGGNLEITGASLIARMTASSDVTFPLTGTLATLAGSEILTNKTIDIDGPNLIFNLRNSAVAANAAIAYSKLNLSNSIVNADINSSAAIAYTKLTLANSILNSDVNSAAGIVYTKLNLAGGIVNSDVNSGANIVYSKLALNDSIRNSDIYSGAGIAYSKLNLTLSLINADVSPSAAIDYFKLNLANSIINSDISATAAIAYSKLNLGGSIVNADISASAAILGTKIIPAFGSQAISGSTLTANSLSLSGPVYSDILRAATSGQTQDLNFYLPNSYGTSGQLLRTDGLGGMAWATVAGSGTVTSVALTVPAGVLSVSGSPITTAGTLAVTLDNQSMNTFLAGPASGASTTPTFRLLQLADLPAFDSDFVPEGTSHLYYTDERAQDAVGGILANSSAVTLTYSDSTPSITADLSNTGVSASSYGSASSVSTFTVDVKGRLTAASSTPISVTSSNVSDFNEAAQDAVGNILVDSASVDFTYSDGSNTITAVLTDTAVTPASYGSASSVATFTVDQKGRLTAAGSTAISVTSSAVSDFNEAAQDAVGGILTDSASVDFTYSDAGNTITAVVLPAGVDHNLLLNYVANQHVDHTSVAINTNANSGLSGGGTIAASRSLLVDPSNASTVAPASGDLILFADISNSNALSKATISSILGTSSITSFKATWITADGTTKTVTHNLGSTDVLVQVIELSSKQVIQVDSAVITDSNTVTLTSSSAPDSSSWRVLILAI